jgi:hypothetical protein
MRIARLLFTLSLSSLAALLLLPGSALAATDIGRVAAQGEGLADCTANTGHVTYANTGSNPYVATTGGVITEWRFRAEANPGTIVMQVLAPDPNNNAQYTPLAETAPAALIANQLNKVQARIPISAGQEIGLRTVTASHGCYAIPVTGFTDFGSAPPAPLPGGGPAMYGFGSGSAATNIAATVEPDGDNDGFGDETQDGCPKNASRSDDCVAPSVKIDKGPKKKTKKPKAKFKFSSDDATATFECSVDGKKFSACASPLKVKGLRKGKHTFEVRAIDKNKNASDEASYGWKVKPKK